MGRIESQVTYSKTEKGKATLRRYLQSEKGRAKKKLNDAKYYARHTAKVKQYVKHKTLRRRYGITLTEYDNLVIAQNGQCACCGNAETLVNKYTGKIQRLSVDHNHQTKEVRGLVCARCNRFVIPAVEHYASIIPAAKKYLKILS